MNINALTILGLVLAVLDFFGLDDRLEKALSAFHVWARKVGGQMTSRFWKLEFPFNFFAGLMALSVALNILVLVGYLFGYGSLPPIITDPQTPIDAIMMTALVLAFLPFALGLLLWFLWYPLLLMSKTPRGIVGSLGLILSLLSLWF